MPVSYTHLDVYKRQDEGIAEGSLDFVQYSDHHAGADHLQGADAEMRGMFSDGMV